MVNDQQEDTHPVDSVSSYQCPFCTSNFGDLKRHFRLNLPDDAEDGYIEEVFEHFMCQYNDDTQYPQVDPILGTTPGQLTHVALRH